MNQFARSVPLGMILAAVSGCSVWVEPLNPPAAAISVDYADAVLNQRRIFVTGRLTPEMAERVIRELLYLDRRGEEVIELNLMTPGGDLNATFAVERVMRGLRSRVLTRALGECNSGGAVLLAAGTGGREAYADGVIVIHGMEVNGDPPARYTELTQDAYTAFWRACARLPEAWLPLPHGKTFVLSAREALDYGVIDRIVETAPAHDSSK